LELELCLAVYLMLHFALFLHFAQTLTTLPLSSSVLGPQRWWRISGWTGVLYCDIEFLRKMQLYRLMNKLIGTIWFKYHSVCCLVVVGVCRWMHYPRSQDFSLCTSGCQLESHWLSNLTVLHFLLVSMGYMLELTSLLPLNHFNHIKDSHAPRQYGVPCNATTGLLHLCHTYVAPNCLWSSSFKQ
jgi:hypothetical protein